MRAELKQRLIRTLQVIADDLLELSCPILRPLLEPSHQLLVQLGPKPLRDPLVGGVPNEDVRKPKCILGSEFRVVGLDQLLAQERLKMVADLWSEFSGRELGDGSPP